MWEYWHVTIGVVTANKILLFFTFAFQRKNLFIIAKIYSYLYYVVCEISTNSVFVVRISFVL